MIRRVINCASHFDTCIYQGCGGLLSGDMLLLLAELFLQLWDVLISWELGHHQDSVQWNLSYWNPLGPEVVHM